MGNMSPDDFQRAIADAMREVFAQRARIPEEEHREHHEWLSARIAKDKARAEFWGALSQKALPAIVVGLLGALATAMWNGWLWLWAHIQWH